MTDRSMVSPWIPLGSAQLVDWKHLNRPQSARGATAWTARVGHEPVLLRSWSNESTTFYEFYFLAHEGLTGTMVVSSSRPEPTRLRLKATIDVEGRLGYSDIVEFQEHPLTGLHGSTIRSIEVSEGELRTERIHTLTSAEAEILEYAPESALLTTCGWWIHSVLEAVRAQVLDGEEPMEHVSASPRSSQLRLHRERPVARADSRLDEEEEEEEEALPPPPPPKKERPPTPKPNSRKQETLEGPNDEVRVKKLTPEPVEPPRAKDKGSKKKMVLIASTNTGDTWEISDPETFIGRSKQCAIVLKSQRVSRKHATITMEDDGFYINDLGAANGIWAGTEKIDREKIEDGSEYIIGDVLVTFTLQH
jgi:FHA domain